MLIYVSSQGPSSPLVQADVTIPSGHGGAPSQVTASMRDANNSVVATGTWAGSQWVGAGSTRRITLSPSFPDATELRTYTLDVTYWWPDQTTTTSSANGELATVSRNTPLGNGWWVTGVERLVATPEGGRLWVGGDGSTIDYHPAGANLWRATNLDHPDSLVWDGTVYKRRLTNGTEVHFDANLRHVRTKPLVGTSTYISYDASGNLQQIIVPSGGPEGATTVRYVFTPGATSETITLYSGATIRTTTLNRDASNQVTSIVDPDSHGVNFVWTGQLMTRRVDRRGYATDFSYDAGRRLTRHQLASGAVFAEDFVPAETKGLAGTTSSTAQPLDSAYTSIDGPRSDVSDVTKVWPSRYGPPSRVWAANGRDTRVTFDATWPALPQLVQAPSGAATSAWYNSRGLVDSTALTNLRNIGDRVVTHYQWDVRFASPVQITGPTGELRSFAYNADGTVQWVQVGSNSAARTYAYYSSSGQYTSSTVPGRTERDSVVYDATLGNPVRVKDRRGFWTVSSRDDLGRSRLDSTQVASGVWRGDSTEYDFADNVIRQVTFGPATSYSTSYGFTAPGIPAGNLSVGAETLFVASTYDAEGNLTNLSRWGSPDPTALDTKQTTFTYDGAGRKTSEGSLATGTLQFSYDPAGNLVQRSDNVGSVTSVFDAANRLVRRMTTAIVNPVTNCRFLDPNSYNGACNYSFPLSTGGTSALTINGDTANFDYDRGGNMIRADNQHARVRRSYSPGGLLLTDTLRVRTLRYADKGSIVPALDFNSHVYGLGLTYDASGRRASLRHPDAIDPCTGPCAAQQYTYDASTGRLTQLTDVRAQSVGFAYTLDGELQDVTYPGSVTEHVVFDADGAPSRRWVFGGGVYLINDTLQYDPRGRVVRAEGLNTGPNGGTQTILNSYSGLGALSALEHDVPNSTSTLEEFRADALGNQYVNQRHNIKLGDADNNPAIRGQVFDLRGRIVQDTARSTAQYYDYDNYWYDADGRTRFRYSRTSNELQGINDFRQEAHYYDGLGRLAVFERHVGDLQQQSLQNDPQAMIATYRYDALGRRVLAHTRHQNCTIPGCESVVDRTVWDGDQLLYEIRTRASDAASDIQVESDLDGGTGEYGTTINAYGRVAYTHAGGIDRPVGAIRLNGSTLVAAFAPQTNWRGQYELATLPTGALLPNAIDWPGQHATAFLGTTVRTDPYEWFGGVITEQADPSGLLYRRARYYDPKTGRFTQPDPIGVAGGLNEYGFANGDPVSYSDPFGLCVKEDVNCANLVRMLRGQSGSEFQAAADRYDGMRQGRVFFTAKSETTDSYGINLNTDGSSETFLGGWTQVIKPGEGNVVLVGDFSKEDFLLFAVHESVHVSSGSTSEDAPWGAAKHAYRQMSGAQQRRASYNADRIYHNTHGKVGRHPNPSVEQKDTP
jgi:RHS repeat-associated protein